MTLLALVSVTFAWLHAAALPAWLHAAALPNNEDTSAVGALMQIGTHRHMQSLMANMSVESALADPPPMPAELQAFVHSQLGANPKLSDAQAFLQARSSKVKKLGKATSGSHSDFTSMNADQAKVLLNKMAKDTMASLDLQRAACIGQHAKQQQLLDETGQDVNGFNAQGTNARAQVMATQTAIKRLQEMLPKLNHELTLHQSKCKESVASLKEQISLIQADTGTLTQVSSASGCMSFLQIELVNCVQHSDEHQQSEKSLITFRHPALRRKVSSLKSSFARNSLQSALTEALLQKESHRHHQKGSGGQIHRRHQKRQHVRHVRHKHPHVSSMHHKARRVRAGAFIFSNSTGSVSANGTTWPSTKVQQCTVSPTLGCSVVQDKLILMQANVLDEVDGRRVELASIEEDCRLAKKNLQDQIRATSMRLQEQQEMLAEATTIMIDAAEQSRLKNKQYDRLESDRKKMESFCQDSLNQASVNQAALELCKIKSIRQELYKMENQRPFIQDCEVSSWTPMSCSKPCGGGVQSLVRQVIVPADNGAACPPLQMQQHCNEQPCPVDCGIDEWSGWTSCSAKCGGGIKQRIRHVKQRPQHGGRLCGPETESMECGTSACDQDCRLGLWSEWSSCSKACGGGFQQQSRAVLASATGLGTCPPADSESRLRYKRCNLDKCQPKSGTLLKCNSSVDVMFLLDASGSTGQQGFDYIKQAGKSLVGAMDPSTNGGNGAQVAVLMYSGPSSMAAYKKCTGEVPSGQTVDLANDCNMVWVSHYTTNTAPLATSIGTLNWRKGSTMVSQALATAEAEVVYGRSNTPAVVVAIADQLPMMPRKTAQVAASLRKKAKLVFAVATGSTDLQKFASWASKPVADNVVYMHSLAELQEPHILNKIIADVCPSVE
eukprot:CAMPEP_0169275604 /NCGR_PEP_ID=MMETSP1016-20121227/52483_1 /TAXON_ID=342587 /ORGANISM="Karlodinium micrum, Strain CCMP2283" /LENGTH=892 /DNA_ID=CAMNT_0009362515 /DNA_START=73 /DNA_END=2751 /DNA_ORIENTATION=+